MAVSLAEAKAHLRLNFDADDAYIEGLIEAAEDHIASTGVALAAPVPAAVRHAILLCISHFYSHREAVTGERTVPLALGVDALVAPYREQNL